MVKHDPRSEITRSAMRWVHKMAAGQKPTLAQRRRFSEWMLRSEEHARQFHYALLAYPLITGGKPVDPLLRQLWMREAPRALEALNSRYPTGLSEQTWRPHRVEPDRRLRLAVAATLLLGCAGAALFYPWQPSKSWQGYVAHADRFRSLRLDDGSQVELYPSSTVQVRYSKEMREVRLVAGGAMFNVQPDPSRPFTVATPHALVRVTGTRFDVRLGGHDALIDVERGHVQVTARAPGSPPVSVGAGERVRISPTGSVDVAAAAERKATPSDEGFVAIQRPLSEIAEASNRRSSKLPVRVEGRACNRPYTARLDPDMDPGIWISAIESDPAMEVHRGIGVPQRVVIRERGDKSRAACGSNEPDSGRSP
jgi:transmembrane sensor